MCEDDVAASLGIASRTVHAHLEHTYRKTNVHSRYELVIRVFREYVRMRGSQK
jgi:DNA-binding NarL/FixJ family response regulator